MTIEITPQPKRIYALVAVSYIAGAFQVIGDKVVKVPYQSVRPSLYAPVGYSHDSLR
jgi:nuclear pore complex protein Nup133